MYKTLQRGDSVFRGLGLFAVFLLKTKLLVGVKVRVIVFCVSDACHAVTGCSPTVCLLIG